MPQTGPDTEPHRLSRTMTRDLDPTTGAKAEPLRRLWPAVLVGAALLLLFNAQGLEKWAARLPESPVSNAAIVAAQQWAVWMERAGPAGVFAAVRRAFRELRGS